MISHSLIVGFLTILIPAVTIASPSTSINKADHSIQVVTGSGVTKIRPWLAGTVRVESAPGKTIPAKKSLAVIAPPDASGWTTSQDTTSVQLKGPRMTAAINKQTGLVSITAADGMPLLQENAQAFQPAVNPARDGLQITTTLHRFPNEHFYGGGVIGSGKAKFNDDDLRDPTAHLVLDNENGHISIPVLYSSRGYSLFWDNPSRGNLNLTPDTVTWNSSAGDLADFYIMAGPTADQAVGEYRKLTGAAPLFPKWAYGFWFSKNRFTSQAEILAAADHFRADKFPIDMLVQDFFYWKPTTAAPHTNNINWGSHQFVPDRYPDPKAMIQQLHEKDHIHFMAVIWAKFDPSDGQHYKELDAANGLFPPTIDWAGKDVRYYDPYDAKAREIYGKQVMDSLFSLGVDAFWMDGAEPEMSQRSPTGPIGLPGTTRFAALDSPTGPVSRVMNAFPMMHVSSVYTAQRATSEDKRVVLLPRSAWAGTQRYGASNWTGDIESDWKDLTWQIEGLQNYSISGLPYITTDVGGYFNKGPEATPELFERWFEWGAFCPIFRVHGLKRQFPWEYGADAEAILKKVDLLRYRLLPYIYTQAGGITFDSGTIMRPLVMDFQDDPKALDTWDEFMFGPSILVCPVYAKGALQRDVYLPGKCDWYDFWTGDRLTGGQTKTGAAAPIDRIPLYVRAGSILPLGPELQYAAEKAADPIELRIYRGADGAFSLYEDQGDSYDYEKGAYSWIPMKWNDATQTLSIGDRKGSFPGMITKRTFHVVLIKAGHGTGEEIAAKSNRDISYQGNALTVSFAATK